jgi:hypothetical protein
MIFWELWADFRKINIFPVVENLRLKHKMLRRGNERRRALLYAKRRDDHSDE